MRYMETERVELKEKVNGELAKEIEAFLNTDGGVIFVGVTDDGMPIGIEDADVTLRKISDIISDQIEPNAIDCVRPEVVFDEGKILIRIVVNKGYSSLYCVKKYGFSPNGCHYRVGSTCKSMTLDMIRKVFERSLSNVDLMVKIPAYYGSIKFEKLKLMLLERGFHIDSHSFEQNLRLRNLDGRYNLLAELLSDTNHVSFIFAKFKGFNKATFSERSDYGNRCIVLAYESMKERLKLENICKTITYPRPRKDIYLYDMDAVNEALVNAVIHNDYRITEPQVSFFADRLEILSHGGLPLGLTKEEFFAGISKPRNEHLMDIFKRLGIVEHTGHGVPTIVAKYGKEAIEISDHLINIVIPFNKEALENHGSINASMKVTGGNGGELNAKEKKVLSLIEESPNVTAKTISQSLSLPPRSVQRYMANLKEKGFILRVGPTKGGYWKAL